MSDPQKKSAVSRPQSKNFLPPEKTYEKPFSAMRNNPRRFRFALNVESILETHQTRNAACVLSESSFYYRFLRDFHSFNLLNRHICGKLKK